MNPGTASALLGIGLGAIVIAGRSASRATVSPRERADALRISAIEAQREASRASKIARDLTAQWSRAETSAR